MLKLILLITLGAPDVGAIEQAYSKWLGYSAVEHGKVERDLANAWNAPRMAGRPYVLMKPESGANIYLRFVQVDAAPGYVPMKTFGWNAIEIHVQDPDALAEKLRNDTPFKILGEPRPLGANSPIRAAQVTGPASEVLYLTRVPPDKETGKPVAATFVDRPFIIILGGPDLEAIRNFYGQVMGQQVGGGGGKARMTVLNKAHGLDIETTHPISMARISPQYSLELDGYPPSAVPRPVKSRELPPAISMVGFEVDSLDGLKAPLLAKPRTIKSAPYSGRRVGVVRGATGELIELIETKTK